MGDEIMARHVIVRERLDALRLEAERERLAATAVRAREGTAGVRVRLGVALVRAGTALAGECAVARLRPRHS